MSWLRRVFWPFSRRGEWPPGPTVPGGGPVTFHCHACKTPLERGARACPGCGEPVS